jgi:hypothetical protein
LTGAVALGDEVLVNVQAAQLGLGSGGFDVLYANLTRGLGLAPEQGAHVMKLPYTPLQHALVHVEEGFAESGEPTTLGSLPVVCCTLHSQVAPVCAGLGRDLAVAYVQLPGGALPVQLSDTVRTLRREGFIRTTVAVGACFGGELAAVSTPSGLLAAAGAGADAVVCAIGPGVVGTASAFGHGGTAAAEAASATDALGGVPVLAARVSEGDPRPRHRGLSHHTLAVLELVGEPIAVAWPEGLDVPDGLQAVELVDVSGWRDACAGLPLAHMGRGPEDDPWFFAAAYAAGLLARKRAR